MNVKQLMAVTVAAALLGTGAAYAAGFFTNGITAATPPLTGNETIPADTNLGSGLNPASEAITLNQLMAFFRAPTALTDAANISIDLTGGPMFTLTASLASGQTLSNPSNISAGQVFRVVVTQGSGGGHTLQYGSFYKWAGGTAPTLSATAGSVDLLTFVVNSATSILGASVLNLK